MSQSQRCLDDQGDLRSDPVRIQDALFAYWSVLENWTGPELAGAMETLDDKYSFILPYFSASVQPADLMDVAKNSKPSAPGVDGWTHSELAILPLQAWYDLMMVCLRSPESLLDSLSGVFKRVPISKSQGKAPAAEELRPIDVFSVILRIHSIALVNALRPWTLRIQHKAQHALSGGVLAACGKLAWTTECAALGLQVIWGISVDFAKMFNTLSPHVAALVAKSMGLSIDNFGISLC